MIESQPDLRDEFISAAETLVDDLQRRDDVAAEFAELGFSRSAWSALGDGGWFSLLLEPDHGGLGLGLRELSALFAAAGRHLLAGPLYEQAVFVPLLYALAEGDARDRMALATSGEYVVTVADPATTIGTLGIAPATVELQGTRLNGVAELVRYGSQADALLVVTVDADGIETVVLVDSNDDGCRIESQESFDPASAYAAVHFEGAEGIRLAGETSTILARVRAGARIMIAVELAAVAATAVDMAVEYAKVREQFGKPIGAFQSIAHMLADAHADVLLLQAHCDAAPPTDATAPLYLKAHAARVARSVCETALQVHGGIAFTMEHSLHRYYKHALALQGRYGDERDLAYEIGLGLLVEP